MLIFMQNTLSLYLFFNVSGWGNSMKTGRLFIIRMKYLIPLLLITLMFNFSAFASVTDMANAKEYILIINPDAGTCAWGETLIPTISKELVVKYPDLDVAVEYMYALGITDEEGINDFKEYLFGKYQKPPKYLLFLKQMLMLC